MSKTDTNMSNNDILLYKELTNYNNIWENDISLLKKWHKGE